MAKFLGVLCKRGHDWEDSGHSLRYKSGRSCVVCCKERKQNSEIKETNRLYMLERNKSEEVRSEKRKYMQGYSEQHKEDKRVYDEKYYRRPEIRERKRKQVAIYVRERRARDPDYAIRCRLRGRLRGALRRFLGSGKVRPSDEYGVDYRAIIKHLGPCPGDLTDYHIDHIRPLSSFNLIDEEQIKEAFAPENHQWLLAKENLRKSDAYDIKQSRVSKKDIRSS